MSNPEPHHRNIFLSKNNGRYLSKNNNSADTSTDPEDFAQRWLERFKPDMQSINKSDIETTLPRFVQDFIHKVWDNENDDVYEKPKKIKEPKCNITRWNKIKEEIFEDEKQRSMENTFKMSRNNEFDRNRDARRSRFRSNSYNIKPKKKEKIFDLAKESANNGFPTLN